MHTIRKVLQSTQVRLGLRFDLVIDSPEDITSLIDPISFTPPKKLPTPSFEYMPHYFMKFITPKGAICVTIDDVHVSIGNWDYDPDGSRSFRLYDKPDGYDDLVEALREKAKKQ